MKKYNLILLIAVTIMVLFVTNIPCNGQSKQVRITDIKFEGKGKATITGKTMGGEVVTIKYGFHGGKPRYTNLKKGCWLTVHTIPGKIRNGFVRSKVKINS